MIKKKRNSKRVLAALLAAILFVQQADLITLAAEIGEAASGTEAAEQADRAEAAEAPDSSGGGQEAAESSDTEKEDVEISISNEDTDTSDSAVAEERESVVEIVDTEESEEESGDESKEESEDAVEGQKDEEGAAQEAVSSNENTSDPGAPASEGENISEDQTGSGEAAASGEDNVASEEIVSGSESGSDEEGSAAEGDAESGEDESGDEGSGEETGEAVEPAGGSEDEAEETGSVIEVVDDGSEGSDEETGAAAEDGSNGETEGQETSDTGNADGEETPGEAVEAGSEEMISAEETSGEASEGTVPEETSGENTEDENLPAEETFPAETTAETEAADDGTGAGGSGGGAGGAAVLPAETVPETIPETTAAIAKIGDEIVTITFKYGVMTDGEEDEAGGTVSRKSEKIKRHLDEAEEEEDADEDEEDTEEEILGAVAEANEGYVFTGWTLKVVDEDLDEEEEERITYELVTEDEELIPEVDMEETATYEFFANFEKEEDLIEVEPIVITIRYSVRTDGEENEEGGTISLEEEVIELPGLEAEDHEEAVNEAEIQGAFAEANEGYLFKGWSLKDGGIITEDAELIPEVDMDATEVYEYVADFEKEEIVIPMPAQFFTDYANGVRINVNAPEGAFPEGTVMKAAPVYDESVAKQIEEGLELADNEVVKSVRAFDIAFYYNDEEIEPLTPIRVELKTNEITEESKVVHLDNEGAVTEMDAEIDTSARVNNATFESDAFSVYAVVETGVDARLFVNFYNGSTLVLETSITRNQVETELNTQIFDPGVGELGDSQLFKGWTDVQDYTAEGLEDGTNEAMQIDDIRTYVVGLLNDAGMEDGASVNFYALVFNSYHISYRDELGVTIHTDEVLYKNESDTVGYTVDHVYAPYYATKIDDEHEELSAKFSGWKQIDPEPAEVTIYENGEEIGDLAALGLTRQDNELTLMAQVDYGHWIVFEQNGSGASFTEAVFVQKGEDLSTVRPADPHWTGYDFYDWFDTREHANALNADGTHQDTGKFAFEGTELDSNITLYAGWTTAATAKVTVLVWKSRLDDDGNEVGYDFVRSIEVEDVQVNATMASVFQGSVGDSTVYVKPKTGDPEPVYIILPGKNATDPDTVNQGYIYNHFDTNTADGKVGNDGNSVLNVYFHRRSYTLKFYYGRGGTNSSSPNSVSTTTGVQNGPTAGSWQNNVNPTVNFTPGTETLGSGNNRYKYYFYGITAKYGQNISGLWPVYSMFPDAGNYRLISWYLMNGARAATGTGAGSGSVKGKFTVMDEQVLGNLGSSEGNFLLASYSTNHGNNWTYHVYFKDANGEVTYDGNKYTLHETVLARSRSASGDDQHAPAYPGYTKIGQRKENNAYVMYFYYEPTSYGVIFKDGVYVDPRNSQIKNQSANTLDTLEYQYGADISECDDFIPTITEGSRYVFRGWFDDSACTYPHSFDGETMPDKDITVYAKWMLKEYEVNLHPNTDGDASFKYRNGNGEGNYGTYGDTFWVDNGESIDDVGGTRDYYEMVGWFSNEQLSKVWNFSFSLNDTIVGKYGRLYTEAEMQEQYPSMVGEINLYAYWRHVLEGADGIDVVYDANGGSNAPTDNNSYTDQAKAVAYAAATPPQAQQGEPQKQFQYWVLQKWDEGSGSYVDTEDTVFPGDRYTVLKENAKCVVTEWMDSEGNTSPTYSEDRYNLISKATYTLKLRAEYEAPEEVETTHIWWFMNDGSAAFRKDEMIGSGADAHNLQINEAVDIEPAKTRTGYHFIGWARVATGNTAEAAAAWEADSSNYTQDLDEADLYLHYLADDSTFHLNSTTGKAVTEVAADERKPYQAMFGVWDPFKYTVVFNKNAADATGTMADQEFEYDEEKALTANAFSREDYNFKGWSEDPEATTATYTDQQVVKNLTEEDGGVVNLYAVWEKKQAHITVHHYLDGTSVSVKADDTAEQNVGTSYTATPATEYQGKTLTVKEYDPDQTITVSATDSENVITVYYTLPLTVTVQNKTADYSGSVQYGYGSTANDHVTVEGLLSGDSISDLNYTRASGTNAGTYNNGEFTGEPVITNGTSTVSYYVITTEAGTLTIDPAEVTITAQDKAFTYTGTAQSWPEYDVDGLVGDDAIEATVTGSITFPSESPVTNLVESYEFTSGTAGNYSVTTANGELTMTNASNAITIKAADDSKTYDGSPLTNSTVTVKEGSLLTGDSLVATATGSATNVADTAEGNNPVAAGYKIMHGDEDVTENYVITTEAGTLTIDPAEVTITAQDKAFTYTGTAQSWPEYDVTGLVGDDAIEATVTGSITFPSESPVTNVVESYEFTSGTADNYSVTTANGELTMTNASVAITIKAEDDSKTYDGSPLTNSTVTVKEGSLLTGDSLVATATGSATDVADTAEGNNPVAAGYKVMHGDEDVTENYAITTEAGTLTINPAAVTITAQDKVFAYTGYAQSWPEYDVDGLAGNDAIEATVTGSITFPSDSPVPNVVASYEFTSGTAGNYTVTTVNGELTMTNASVAITIKAADDSKTYDGSPLTNSTVTVTEGSLLEGDELVATAEGSATDVADTARGNNKVAAGYKVMNGNEDVTENYAITAVAGTLTINKRNVTLTSEGGEKVYDGEPLTNDEVTVSGEGFADGEGASYEVTGSQTLVGQSPNTFNYTLNEGTDPDNYTIVKREGTLKVTDEDVSGDLVVTKADKAADAGTAAATAYASGDTVTFNITATNIYEDPRTITLSEIEGVSFADGTAGEVHNDVEPGATVETTATYIITDEDLLNGSFTNTVTAAISNGVTRTAEATVQTVEARGHLTVTKETISQPADGEAYKLGENIIYEIKVINDGTLTITDIIVTDDLTEDEWTIASLATGETKVFDASHLVTEADILAGSVRNVATATGTSPDPDEPDVPVDPGETEDPTEDPNGHLTVTKTTTSKPAEGEVYKLGETITYEITVTNDGNLTITDVIVKDELTGDEWTIPSLAPREEATFRTTHEVTEADILAGSVKNVATATGTSPDPDKPDVPVDPGETEDPTEDPNGHLTVTKTTTSKPAEGEVYKLGETITYEITVTNDGNLTITDVIVKDELTGDEWTIPSLALGEVKRFTAEHVVTEADLIAGSVRNVATATGTSPDPKNPDVPSDPGETEDPTEDPVGHLTVTKTTTSQPAEGKAYKLGETISYEITVTNDGNLTITDITVTDELTGDVWTIASLAKGASETFRTQHEVTEADLIAGSVKNVATATGTSPDPKNPDVPSDPGETEDPTEDPVGHLTVTKTTTSQPAEGEVYKLGETITYEITVTNDGNLTITDITVTDELTGDVWTIKSLAPGATETFRTQHEVTEADLIAGSVRNVATATGTSPDPDKPDVPVDPGETEDPTEDPVGHITITKTTTSQPAEGKAYKLGETISYEIAVTNDGNLTITDITVKDDLTGDEWTIASLAPNENKTFTANYVITEADILAGSVRNEATAAGTSPDPDVPNVPVTPGEKEDPTEEPKPEITAAKVTTSASADKDGYVLGETIEYTITVTNTGNLTVNNVQIKDELTGLNETIAALAPGEKAERTTSHKVTAEDVAAGSVVNEAVVSGTAVNQVPVEDKPNVTDKTKKQELTITADSDEKVYDSIALTKNSYTSTGLIDGHSIDSVTISGSLTDAGSIANKASGAKILDADGTDVTAAYAVSYVDGTLKVTPAPVTVKAEDKTKIQGTPDPELTAVVTGLIGNDTVAYTLTREAGETAGTYVITPAGAAAQGNYTVTYVTGNLLISLRGTILIVAEDHEKVYDGETVTEAELMSLIKVTMPAGFNESDYDFEYRLAGGETVKNVGGYTIITGVVIKDKQGNVVGEYGSMDAAGARTAAAMLKNAAELFAGAVGIAPMEAYADENSGFELIVVPGTYTITPREVTVKADDAEKRIGMRDPAFTASLNNAVAGEEDLIKYTVARKGTADRIGTIAGEIVAAGDRNQGNYVVNFVPGDLTITRRNSGGGSSDSSGDDPMPNPYENEVGPSPAPETGVLGAVRDAVSSFLGGEDQGVLGANRGVLGAARTGDESGLLLHTLLMMLSAASMSGLALIRRKREDEE